MAAGLATLANRRACLGLASAQRLFARVYAGANLLGQAVLHGRPLRRGLGYYCCFVGCCCCCCLGNFLWLAGIGHRALSGRTCWPEAAPALRSWTGAWSPTRAIPPVLHRKPPPTTLASTGPAPSAHSACPASLARCCKVGAAPSGAGCFPQKLEPNSATPFQGAHLCNTMFFWMRIGRRSRRRCCATCSPSASQRRCPLALFCRHRIA